MGDVGLDGRCRRCWAFRPRAGRSYSLGEARKSLRSYPKRMPAGKTCAAPTATAVRRQRGIGPEYAAGPTGSDVLATASLQAPVTTSGFPPRM